MAKEDGLIVMLKERGLTQEQIAFLVNVLRRVKEQMGDAKSTPEAAVRYVLEHEIGE